MTTPTGFSISLPGQLNEGQIFLGQILKPIINTIPPTIPVSPFTLSTSHASLVYDSSGNLSLTSYSSSLPTVSLFATNDNYSGSITLTTYPSAISLAFDSSGQTVGPYYTLDLSSHLNVTMPELGDPIPTITWTSSRPGVATVDSNGLVTGLRLGVTTITASLTDYRTLTATIVVTVTPNLNTIEQQITDAQIYLPTSPLYENTNTQAYLVINPPFSRISSLVWSVSTPTTAYIHPSTGHIRVVNANDTYSYRNLTIQATIVDSFSNIIYTSTSVTCYKKPEALVLHPTSITCLQIGQTATINTTIYPADATTTGFTWTSSDPSIAVVYNIGESADVTGISNGTCTITGQPIVGTCKASVIVSVENGLATVTSDAPATLLEGTTFQLTLTTAGSNTFTGSYSTVFWNTSDSTIATISNSGLITAIAPGTCTISGLVSGKSGSVPYSTSLTVTRSVKNVVISPASLSLILGQSTSLSVTLFPSNVDVTTVTWTSTNPAIATVDSSGNVTAVKTGTTNIRATADGGTDISSSIPVSVGVPITSATIVIPSTIMMGSTAKATVLVEPVGAAYDFISWGSKSTEQTSATVNSFGQITASGIFIPTLPFLSSLATQSSSFSAIVGNQFTSSLISTLSPAITIIQPVSVITMSQVYYTKTVGMNFQLFWTIYPASAYNKNVRWTSSNTSVATVDSSGLVTTVSVGDVTITAIAVDTGRVSAVTLVTVTA